MKRLALPFLLALLSVSMAVPGCAGPFDQCVRPEIGKVTWTGTAQELGHVVEAFLLCEPTSEAEVPMCAVAGLEALEQSLGPDGRQVINCIIACYGTGGGTQQLRARAKAMAVRRGIHASELQCKGFQIAERGGVGAHASGAVDPREGIVPAPSVAGVELGDSASPAKPASGILVTVDTTDTIPAVACMDGTVPQKRFGEWDCYPVPSVVYGEAGGVASVDGGGILIAGSWSPPERPVIELYAERVDAGPVIESPLLPQWLAVPVALALATR